MWGMVRALWELEVADARRSGQIADRAILVTALRRVLEAGAEAASVPLGAAKLALTPRHGVTEFFVCFVCSTKQAYWQYKEATLLEIIEGAGIGRSGEE